MVVKLHIHETRLQLGLSNIRRKDVYKEQKEAIINGVLHKMVVEHEIWHTVISTALERPESEPVIIVESSVAKEAAMQLVGDAPCQIMTPNAFVKHVTVKDPILVICPIRPSRMNTDIKSALLLAKELHIIRSIDHAQERFLRELRQGTSQRSSTQIREIWYKEKQ